MLLFKSGHVEHMDDLSFLQHLDTEAIEELYQKYRKDPDSVDPSWHHFFQGFDLARRDYSHPESESLTFDEEFKVINLINGYRKRGHLFTQTNPVRTRRKYFPNAGPGKLWTFGRKPGYSLPCRKGNWMW